MARANCVICGQRTGVSFKRCVCLVPVWSECCPACGYHCARCRGTLNFAKKIPSWEERRRSREQHEMEKLNKKGRSR